LDTRHKILSASTAGEALRGEPKRKLLVGHFDPLYAAHARRLKEICADGEQIVVVLTDPPDPLLPAAARAELVAGLQAVAHVIVSDENGIEELIHSLAPVEVLREGPGDERRTGDLISHVRARQVAK
jgi:bifunctional ADP-heptose synthase (sugar kinase/adenylyltransferase)